MSVNKSKFFRAGVIFSLLLILSGCHPRSHLLEPKLNYTPQKRQIEGMSSEFKALSSEELEQEWGKELKIGISFIRELDYYRAITSLKRSLFLMPEDVNDRHIQVEFHIIQCYYFGRKYQEAIESFEFGTIRYTTSAFPAFRDLLIILYESYLQTGQCEKAEAILNLMEKGDPETALDLKLFSSLSYGDLPSVRTLTHQHPYSDDFSQFNNLYCKCSKSVRTAQFLNAAVPGAGYYYVGQKKSALTSFILNTSFIAASYYFFDQGNWGAGLFTASLEFGWYLGGINGAGLAAKEYNECLYNKLGKNLMIKHSVFPVLMLQTGF